MYLFGNLINIIYKILVITPWKICSNNINRGDIIITEVQHYTWDTDEEWFEFYNTTGSTIDLFGLEIMNEEYNPYFITEHLYIESEEYLIAGRRDNANHNGGLELDIDYGSFTLGQNSDFLSIFYDDSVNQQEIARIEYTNSDNWGTNRGRSKIVTDVNLIPNNDTNYWCESSTLYYGFWIFNTLYLDTIYIL